mmetsp:Transcript_35850/g.44472  ORF Transcript_35850/g.44472 Transcript_35850/m.44472 type:complete len:214 (-) Transcript_35850:2145-2786(-)
MGDFKKNILDVDDVVNKVKEMFYGDRNLIEGFNTFLPPGYSIEYDELRHDKEKVIIRKTEGNSKKKSPSDTQAAKQQSQGVEVPGQGSLPPVVTQTPVGSGLMAGNIPVAPMIGGDLQPIVMPTAPQPPAQLQEINVTQGENILPVDDKTGLPADWKKNTTPKEPGSDEMVVTYTAPNGVEINNAEELETFVAQFSDAKWIVNQLRKTIVFDS